MKSSLLLRILRTLAGCGLVGASLLTFPQYLPWMAGFWIAAFLLLFGLQKPAWPPLAAGAAILLVKRPDLSPGLGALFAAWVLGLAALVAARRKPWARKAGLGCALLLVATWTIWTILYHRDAHGAAPRPLDPARPIVCIGDSITSGGWPSVLQERLRVPVLDLAHPGIQTSGGISRLPHLLEANPQAVVIELGGHDYLLGRSRAATRENLERLIRESRRAGAEVILFEIPRGFITDGYQGLERELARRHGLELIQDGAIRSLILRSPHCPPGMWGAEHLSSDGLHPNARGHRFLADRVSDSLRRIFGDAIFTASP